MLYVVALLVFLIVALGLGLIVFINRSIQLMNKVDELGDQVNESLDLLDSCHHKISKVLETPVGSDDPTVRELLNDIRDARHAILLIANKLVTFDEDEDEDENV